MTDFEQIRPYHDDEVEGVMASLLADQEFISFIARFKLPRLNAIFPRVARGIIYFALARQSRKVTSIKSFQQMVSHYAERLVRETMTEFTFEGLDELDPSRPCLFVGNHRDIAGDSMLLDYALYVADRDTVRIAVGDNLVQRQFATDLMKLNKSFFIRRSETGAKRIYAALMESSEYIQQSIRSGHSVWIAQSEGRAKDCLDETDPALIKMLMLASRKQPLGETLVQLNIVPVSISYEYDPCDALKARELYALATEGSYKKAPGEDLLSLVKGLGEFKGKVVLKFGRPVISGCDTADAVAEQLDEQILENLCLFPVNYWALSQLAALPASPETEEYRQVWQQVGHYAEPQSEAILTGRFDDLPDGHRLQMLKMYANPIVNKVRHGSGHLAPV